MEETTQIAAQVTELSYALDTFYFLVCGALVMWMAAGFTMLEAGLVRAKNTTSILTKNIALYSLATLTFLAGGYQIMYGVGLNPFIPEFGVGTARLRCDGCNRRLHDSVHLL